ncbi:unnamed protein product [Symbiodinium necroappetens]|uniref:Uncharacterized protein n=1 Tax=Symbiodinium necroappetens TaxID=1628268 RepID=A0A812KCD5_9DINO|nr:unnamed protein product [Symbiodinium necroappetens]
MSSYSGSAIRTTHMTGIATDIGLITGRQLMSFFQKRCFRRCRCCEHRKLLGWLQNETLEELVR